MRVVIMRACPGSGKSTYIKNNLPGALIASADTYFVGKDGVYRFNIARIGAAHEACFATFADALSRSVPLVVVDNTNIKVRDFKRYVDAARARGYAVEIVRLACDPAVAAKRNVHGVPADIVARMARDLTASVLPADYPAETVVKTD